jgi:signal transduction histidine kinase/ActR/RegA family two-component response regulator
MRMGIKLRVLVLALVPGALIAVFLAGFFVYDRFEDLEYSLYQRGRTLARQLAPAAEYAVFSGNREALEALANGVVREPDLKAVTFLGRHGETLLIRGRPAGQAPPPDPLGLTEIAVGVERSLVFSMPIVSTLVRVDDLYAPTGRVPDPDAPATIGRVLVEMGTESLVAERIELLGTSGLVTVLVLGLSLWIAMGMSRGVTRPILRISETVERIALGDLSARAPTDSAGALRRLEEGVNDMASKLQSAREDLEGRIAAATSQLLQKKDEAERANQAKSRFLAAASHDLRQPMHALSLFVAQLAQQAHPPGTRDLIRNIEASVDALDDLLHSLLDISKLDAGIMVPNVSVFPLDNLLERLGHDYGNTAREKGLRFRVVPSGVWVRSDPLLLERILLNLVANAVRYTDHGAILIGCRRRGEHLRIEVRDSGIGIPQESQQVIFEEFVQLQNPERDRGKGLGLGLAIVDRLAWLLGHTVHLRSRPRRGSVFAVEVRIARPQEVGSAATQAAGSNLLAGRSILVVDDDAMVRESLAGLLESWGCTVTTAESEDEVVDACPREGERPDLMVCDFRLREGLDGIALIDKLRNRCGCVLPTILVTGDTDAQVAQRAAEAGLPLLHKPVRPAKLRAAMQSALAEANVARDN